MPKERSPDDVHDIGNVQVGRPYRGEMVTNIEIEDPIDLPNERVKVRRLITLESGIIVIEDTVHDRGEIYDGAGNMLPLAEIQFPHLDPDDFQPLTGGGKADDEDPEAKKKKQELLRQKAKEMLNKRRPSLVKPDSDDDNDDDNDDENHENDDDNDEPKDMTVHIQTPSGKRLPVKVKPTDTVEDLKNKVEDEHDIPVKDQNLELKGKPSDNPNATMDQCGVKPGDVIDMTTPSEDGMKVRVQTPNGKIVSLSVAPTDCIQEIKEKLTKEHDIPTDNAGLTFKGDPLDDPDDTLDDYGIKNGDLLKLEPNGITVNIQVHTPDGKKGKKIPIKLNPESTIDDLKDKLQQAHGIPKRDQLLKYDGDDLDEPSKTLKDLGIEDGDVVDLMPAQIKVKTPDGKVLAISVDPSTDTVPDLKQRIANEHGIPVKKQDLSFKGKPLTDDSDTPLKELGINHGDVVDMSDAPVDEKPSSNEPDGKTNERVRTLSPNSVWVYPTAESAPKHGEPNNLQGIWAVPPGEDAGTEPVEVNIHPIDKEPVGDKKSLHGAYGYINGAKPDANGVVDPANIVFYPPETKEFRPDFEQVGWWSNPNSSSETYVSYKWVGADCYYTKKHTVTLMGHTMTFHSEWVE